RRLRGPVRPSLCLGIRAQLRPRRGAGRQDDPGRPARRTGPAGTGGSPARNSPVRGGRSGQDSVAPAESAGRRSGADRDRAGAGVSAQFVSARGGTAAAGRAVSRSFGGCAGADRPGGGRARGLRAGRVHRAGRWHSGQVLRWCGRAASAEAAGQGRKSDHSCRSAGAQTVDRAARRA
ncbi:hypothetical protein OY671_010452, partial [Metschnikowia pulcherrima]